MRNPLMHSNEELSVSGFLVLVCLGLFLAALCGMALMAYTPPEPGPWQRPAVDPTQSVYDSGGR